MHVNVWANRLAELGLVPGAWLRDAKRAITAEAPDDAPVTTRWREGATMREVRMSLRKLRQAAIQCVPGQKITYVSGVAGHAGNVERITRLAAADLRFIEATLLERDADEARHKKHLTARQAGSIAQDSGAREIVPFHFSPRYAKREAAVVSEAGAAFQGVIA
jgi:ribonuclease Z